MTIEMAADAASVVVDARGMRCPWPALRLARAMRDARDVLLLADDPQAGREAAALAAQHGWTLEPAGEAGWRARRD
ncbi:sulfurtransferase TusA family protein [Sphingopyxis sp. Geo48]|uniref:sulfurtransferase TusA family protein n=1 Tax=Sphingopyxis sp. Geo48 TaxID=545241 RepID=UPI0024B73CCD|nr:sulfurtransferase TusA family protein [Sphingopyxis sp. Geo48]